MQQQPSARCCAIIMAGQPGSEYLAWPGGVVMPHPSAVQPQAAAPAANWGAPEGVPSWWQVTHDGSNVLLSRISQIPGYEAGPQSLEGCCGGACRSWTLLCGLFWMRCRPSLSFLAASAGSHHRRLLWIRPPAEYCGNRMRGGLRTVYLIVWHLLDWATCSGRFLSTQGGAGATSAPGAECRTGKSNYVNCCQIKIWPCIGTQGAVSDDCQSEIVRHSLENRRQ